MCSAHNMFQVHMWTNRVQTGHLHKLLWGSRRLRGVLGNLRDTEPSCWHGDVGSNKGANICGDNIRVCPLSRQGITPRGAKRRCKKGLNFLFKWFRAHLSVKTTYNLPRRSVNRHKVGLKQWRWSERSQALTASWTARRGHGDHVRHQAFPPK